MLAKPEPNVEKEACYAILPFVYKAAVLKEYQIPLSAYHTSSKHQLAIPSPSSKTKTVQTLTQSYLVTTLAPDNALTQPSPPPYRYHPGHQHYRSVRDELSLHHDIDIHTFCVLPSDSRENSV